MNYSNPKIEPRLSEYIKKKNFFEENNITSPVPLEKQYMITKTDLETIKKYITNKNNNNNHDNYQDNNNDDNFIECKVSQFPSTQIKDHRLNRINQKIKRDKDASLQKHNIENLKNTYDMYSRNFSSTTSCDFNNEFANEFTSILLNNIMFSLKNSALTFC